MDLPRGGAADGRVGARPTGQCVCVPLLCQQCPRGPSEVALLESSGTPPLPRPPLPVMLPAWSARYPTAADQALHRREFDLCGKAPAIRTRSVSTVRRKTVAPDLRVRRVTLDGLQTPDSEVRRAAFERIQGGRLLCGQKTKVPHVMRIRLIIVRRWKENHECLS